MEIIIYSYNIFKKTNGKKEIEIKQRDMISVLTMYSLLKYFCYVELVEEAIYKKSEERICVKDIVKTFYSTYKRNFQGLRYSGVMYLSASLLLKVCFWSL